ncbi:MAG TPA: YbaY family lipoprotein, partial [Phycisphaerales bacterium]|nr:YbaY family lipoprotein [Phycisphaerales bacterium]
SGAVAPAYPGKVTGSVLYRERIMLPPDAEVVVQLIDASLVEAPPVVIAEQRIPTRGKAPPYEFSVVYDPAAIVSERRYQVRAEILVRGSRRFTTETAMPVITRGSPSAVEIVTVAVRQ